METSIQQVAPWSDALNQFNLSDGWTAGNNIQLPFERDIQRN